MGRCQELWIGWLELDRNDGSPAREREKKLQKEGTTSADALDMPGTFSCGQDPLWYKGLLTCLGSQDTMGSRIMARKTSSEM